MKVSLNWLQNYFEEPLPDAEEVAEALTMHAFEVEDVEGDSMDVKILPDRASYALSHRGVALELGAALNRPLSEDPLRRPLPEYAPTDELSVDIEVPDRCGRYMGAVVKGVTVGPSPQWLKEALEAVGQRSINNVVDATNFVMLNIGQPLHAFDAAKLAKKDGAWAVQVTGALEGERITTLSGDDIALPEGTLIIRDRHADQALGIAGIKGGKAAEVDASTTELIVEAANFDGPSVRRAAQGLKLFTDASLRFQNRLSPQMPAYGMREVLALITQVAGGEVTGVVDAYPSPEQSRFPVSCTLSDIERVLGVSFSESDVADALTRLSLTYATPTAGSFEVSVPFERRDIAIAEDLVEEVGRTLGYDRVPSKQLPPLDGGIENVRANGLEQIKDFLVARGYTEVATRSFNEAGEIMLRNPLDATKPALRGSLAPLLSEALQRAVAVAPRALGPKKEVLLFEVGTIFTNKGELLSLGIAYAPLIGKKQPARLEEEVRALEDAFPEILHDKRSEGEVMSFTIDTEKVSALGSGEAATHDALGAFEPFSVYPFALRDIAVWTPAETPEVEVAELIRTHAGPYVVRIDCFDRFEKEGRISYAFRLVFESMERTLTDEDIAPSMEAVTSALNNKAGYEVR